MVYFLHGYGIGADAYMNMLWASDAADRDAAAGTSKEMIVVFPDSFTVYNGSMYSNSPTTGNWETFITEDLISYIDSHYRTLANRDSRGLAGHSMGGYGTLRIAMKYPELYAAIYPMSSCCLMNNPGAGRGGPPPSGKEMLKAMARLNGHSHLLPKLKRAMRPRAATRPRAKEDAEEDSETSISRKPPHGRRIR